LTFRTWSNRIPKKISKTRLNAVGFGDNIETLLLSK
jgi:hypothetical protein